MGRRTQLLALGTAVVFGLSGCAGTDDDEVGAAASSSLSSSDPAPEGTTAQQTVEDPTEAPAADPEHCLEGVWLADNAYFLASMQELGDGVDSVLGQVNLTFLADGTMTTEYIDWQITGSGEDGAVIISRSGVDGGVYTVADSTLTLEETEVGSSMTVSMGEMEMPVTPTPVVFADAPLTCAATSASVDAPEGTLKLSRD